LTLLTLSISGRAHADAGADRATAEALSDAASQLMAQGKYAEGCSKYEASQRLDPSARRLLQVAECNERRGMIASAWTAFGWAAEEAEGRGEQDLARAAREGAARLEANLGKMAVVVSPAADVKGLVVVRDGSVVPPSVFGLPVAVDPGPHVVSASAPGKRTWSAQIELSPGKAAVTLTIPPLDDERPASANGSPDLVDPWLGERGPSSALGSGGQGNRSLIVPAEAPERDTGSTQRTVGLLIGGAGLASVAVGTVFALKANSTRDELAQACPAAACPADMLEIVDKSRQQARAATVFFGLGAAALVGGAIVYFTSPSSRPEHPSAFRLAPALGPGTTGMIATGQF
jgi:serine/threonine-protein kinase